MFEQMKRRRGQSIVEYMLLLSLISMSVAVAVTTTGEETANTFTPANESLAEAVLNNEQETLDAENKRNIEAYRNNRLEDKPKTDSTGGSGSTTTPKDTAPVADFAWNPKVPLPRQEVRVLNTSIDSDGDRIVREEWTLNGKAVSSLPKVFPVGDNELRLRVMDERNRYSDWTRKTLTVQNQAPRDTTLKYTPSADIRVTTVVSFVASAKDPNEDVVTYEWYVGGTKQGERSSTFRHTFPIRGSHLVEVIPVDEHGARGEKKGVTVKVVNSPPTGPTLTCSPNKDIYNDVKVTCVASGSTDAEKDAITYEYQNRKTDGLYPVGDTLVQARAVDTTGAVSGWTVQTVRVSNRVPTKPQLNARVLLKNNYYSKIDIEAYGSVDPDGGSVSYQYSGLKDDKIYYNGSHTIKARAYDGNGGFSEWAEYTFDAQSPMKNIFTNWENYVINSASGEWRYDETTDMIFSTKNVGWTGFYNPSDSTLKDYRLTWSQAVLNDGDDDSIGMTFRMQDAKNFYFVAFDNGQVNNGDIKGGIYKMTNGSMKRLVSIPHIWKKNVWDNMVIEAEGNRIIVRLNGEKYEYTDTASPYLNGSFGPFTRSQAMGHFKGVTMEVIE